MKARIHSNYYREAGLFVTTEESRYALHSLRIEPHPEKGVLVIATDGHSMAVFHDTGGECEREGVTLVFNKSLSDMCTGERILEVPDDESARLLDRGREVVRFSGIVEPGEFPDWRKVLPKWSPDVERNDYNPEYLERCAQASGAPYAHLAIWSGSSDTESNNPKPRAAVVIEYERDDCFFLVMPMRQSSDAKYPELIEKLRRKDETDIESALAQAAT